MSDGAVSADVGTRLLFENERVRVWDLNLVPGQSTGLHRHESDFFYIAIGGGTLQGIDAEGNLGEPSTMEDGHVVFRNIPDEEVHEAVNVGDEQWRNIVVELIDKG
jgi:quercetin dioxygenase-like cupin family protein